MCDHEEVYSSLPSILSWVSTHTALGGSGTNCVGMSRPPSHTQSSRHWVKAHTDPQPPPHKHRHPCNLPQMDTGGQSLLPWTDYLSSPLQAPAEGKGDAQRKSRWVPESNGWCWAASHWKSPLQHSKTTAGHCTNAGSGLHALFLCVLKRLIIPIHLECGLLISVLGKSRLPERHILNTPRDLLLWYDWLYNSGDLSSYDHSFPLQTQFRRDVASYLVAPWAYFPAKGRMKWTGRDQHNL